MKIICESAEDLTRVLPVLRKKLKGADGVWPVWTIGVQCALTGVFRDHIVCHKLADLTDNLEYLTARLNLRTSEIRHSVVIED